MAFNRRDKTLRAVTAGFFESAACNVASSLSKSVGNSRADSTAYPSNESFDFFRLTFNWFYRSEGIK